MTTVLAKEIYVEDDFTTWWDSSKEFTAYQVASITNYHDNTLFLDDYMVRGVLAKEIEVEDGFTTWRDSK